MIEHGFKVFRPENHVVILPPAPPTLGERLYGGLRVAARLVFIAVFLIVGAASFAYNPKAFLTGFAVGFVGTTLAIRR